MYCASCIIAGSFYCEAQGIGFVISRSLGGKEERAERGCGFVSWTHCLCPEGAKDLIDLEEEWLRP
jgi:hypothetical protein